MSKHADVFFDRFMESGSMEFDAHTPLGADPAGKPKGTLELYGETVVNSDPTAHPIIRLVMKAKIPFDALPTENNFSYRHTLKLKNEEEWDQDDIVIGCEIDAKDPSRFDVKQFNKDYDLQATGKPYKPSKDDLVKSENKIVRSDADKKAYKATKVKHGDVDFIET